jgi:hypothetical protein
MASANDLTSPTVLSPAPLQLGVSRSTQHIHGFRTTKDDGIEQAVPPPVLLETLNPKEMSRLLGISTAAAVLAVGIKVAGMVIARAYAVSNNSPPFVPRFLLFLDGGFSLVLLLLLISMAFSYGRNVHLIEPEHRTAHQLATLMLILIVCPVMIPIRALAEIVQTSIISPDTRLLLVDAIVSTCGIGVILFYSWITIRLCRKDHFTTSQNESPTRALFVNNATILLITALYVLVRISVAGLAKVAFAPLPFESFASFLSLISSNPAKKTSIAQAVAVSVLTVIEIVLLFGVVRSYFRTTIFLASSDLNEFRTESIHSRFFGASSARLLIPCLVIAALDYGYPSRESDIFRSQTGFLLLSPPIFSSAVALLLFSFVARQAYVNLPSTADDIFNKMKPGNYYLQHPKQFDQFSEAPTDSISSNSGRSNRKLLTYTATDRRDRDRGLPTVDPQCFSLESAVLLFNFAWLVYTHGTAGFSPAKPSDFGKPEYRVSKHIKDEELDVHAVIVDGEDRLVIAFKGSNSVANAAIDKDVRLTSASHAFRNKKIPGGKFMPGFGLHGKASDWRGCKMHRGYAKAYSRVRSEIMEEVQRLFDKKCRPIYVSGQYVKNVNYISETSKQIYCHTCHTDGATFL